MTSPPGSFAEPGAALAWFQESTGSHIGFVLQSTEREIHYVHWASKAYEDESVFMSEAHLGWQ